MVAAILCTGNELTRGAIADTNGAWLARELTEAGLEVDELAFVGDELGAIAAALTRLGAASELLICTGGLGPTTDDLTAAAVARVLGVPLLRDPASMERIRARLATFGRGMSESNAKQADFPVGARILANDAGTAPGFAVRIGRADAWFLPGVPEEMRAMFAARIAPELRPNAAGAVAEVCVRTFGLGESAVNDGLAGLERELDVSLGYRATFPEVEVKVLARRATPAEADSAARRGADAVTERLGVDIAYGEGEPTLPAVVAARLAEAGVRLGLAESCTGGMVSALLTDFAGASEYLVGGAVAYANSAKEQLLGVPAATLAAHGAVSPEVARAMAEGAARLFSADVALAITGVAGPSGGSPEKPVGTVEFAVVGAGRTLAERAVFAGSRRRVRTLAAWTGLRLVLRHLDARDPPR